MRLVLTSDLHGDLPQNLPEGDVLCLVGDVAPLDDHSVGWQREWFGGPFAKWLERVGPRYEAVLGVAGNHDFLAQADPSTMEELPWTYLCDSGVELGGLSFWGTPWTSEFEQWAFMADEDELATKFAAIPEATDVLLSHGPPYGTADELSDGSARIGSRALAARLLHLPEVQLIAFGHNHDGYGAGELWTGAAWVNCAHMTEDYRPINRPVVFDLG